MPSSHASMLSWVVAWDTVLVGCSSSEPWAWVGDMQAQVKELLCVGERCRHQERWANDAGSQHRMTCARGKCLCSALIMVLGLAVMCWYGVIFTVLVYSLTGKAYAHCYTHDVDMDWDLDVWTATSSSADRVAGQMRRNGAIKHLIG